MNPAYQKLIRDLEAKISNASILIQSSRHDDLSDQPEERIYDSLSGLRASIIRLSGSGSSYDSQAASAQKEPEYIGTNLRKIQGVANSLLSDATAGMLEHLTELVHAETFVDFIEMSEHLISGGYKDAAAVVAGSSLELHLRNLGRKHSVAVDSADGRPLKSDRINADLTAASVYSKLDQKNVTAWLDLRNKAAHGHYSEYSKEQVELLCSAVRNFVTRNPA